MTFDSGPVRADCIARVIWEGREQDPFKDSVRQRRKAAARMSKRGTVDRTMSWSCFDEPSECPSSGKTSKRKHKYS